jgi:ABC-type branched-subunit amino acid transport system substrate-binding protein
VFYGGSSVTGATTLFNQVAQTTPPAKLFAPSALAQDAFVSALSAHAQSRLYVSSPGFMPSAVPPSASTFESAFRSAYGHAPAVEAIFGYEAMSAVLAVLHQAGSSANSRSTVVGDFLRLRRSGTDSVLGAYSINSAGDISIAPVIISRVKGGSLVPFKAAQG